MYVIHRTVDKPGVRVGSLIITAKFNRHEPSIHIRGPNDMKVCNKHGTVLGRGRVELTNLRHNDSFLIGAVKITVTGVRSTRLSLGFEAPTDMPIWREEEQDFQPVQPSV